MRKRESRADRTKSGPSLAFPGAVRRVLRFPALAVAYATFSLLSIGAGGIAWATSATVSSAIDENWRGMYDILVVPESTTLAAPGTGFVDANFATTTSSQHISADQLSAIRAIPSVDVAAPIGFLGRVIPEHLYPNIAIPLPTEPTAYRLDVALKTNDGIADRAIQSYTSDLILDPTGLSDGPLPLNRFLGDDMLGQGVSDGFAYALLPELPEVASSLVAVDPVAEKELIGAAGKFLDPLKAFDRLQDGATPLTCSSVTALPPAKLAEFEALTVDDRGTTNPSTECIYGTENEFAPFARNEAAYPQLEMSVSISRLDASVSSASSLALEAARTAPTERIGVARVDIGTRLRPFGGADLNIPWPGNPASDVPRTVASASIVSTSGSLQYALSGGRLRLVPYGVLQSTGKPGDLSNLTAGDVQTYRPSLPAQTPQIGSHFSAGAAPLELSTFDPNEVATRDKLVGSPLGAYDPATISIIGRDGTSIEPALNGLGPTAASATVITTLDGAAAMGVDNAIDAVRVRVRGDYSSAAEGLATISRIAEAIRNLGLRADVVGGSSFQEIPIVVADFVTGSGGGDASSTTLIARLEGTQPFVRLGVVTQVQSALAEAMRGIYLTTLAAATILIVVVHATSVRTRSETSQLMARAGVPRARRFMWDLAGASVPVWSGLLALVIGLPLGGVSVAGHDPVVAASIILGAVVASALFSACLATFAKPRRRGHSSAVPRVVSGWTLGLRNVVKTPALVLGRTTALVLVSVSFAAAALTTIGLVQDAMITSLGQQVTFVTLPLQALTGLIACAAAVVMLIQVERHDLLRRGVQTTALIHAGWSRRQRQRVQLVRAVAGVVLGAAALATITPMIELMSDHWLLIAATYASATCACLLGSLRAEGTAARPRRRGRRWSS